MRTTPLNQWREQAFKFNGMIRAAIEKILGFPMQLLLKRLFDSSFGHAEIQMLGVPLGNDSFVSGFVEKKLLGRLLDTVNRLVEFEDTSSYLFIRIAIEKILGFRWTI